MQILHSTRESRWSLTVQTVHSKINPLANVTETKGSYVISRVGKNASLLDISCLSEPYLVHAGV